MTIHDPLIDFAEAAGTVAPVATGDRFRLRGRTVGFRTEGNWKSWIHVLGRWSSSLEAEGAACSTHVADGVRVGAGAAETTSGVAEWARSVDIVVSGLGTCGSCTSYTVVDALTAAREGTPSVAIVTSEFAVHARSIARHLQAPELTVFELPHPLEGRSLDELDRVADEYFEAFADRIGALA